VVLTSSIPEPLRGQMEQRLNLVWPIPTTEGPPTSEETYSRSELRTFRDQICGELGARYATHAERDTDGVALPALHLGSRFGNPHCDRTDREEPSVVLQQDRVLVLVLDLLLSMMSSTDDVVVRTIRMEILA